MRKHTPKRAVYLMKRHLRAFWPEAFFWFRFKGLPEAGESARNQLKLVLYYIMVMIGLRKSFLERNPR